MEVHRVLITLNGALFREQYQDGISLGVEIIQNYPD